jgi:FkbM family methyltransferase
MSDQPAVRGPRVRFTLRRLAQTVGEHVPVPWLLRLRAGYLDEDRSRFARRWRRALLEVVRLRGIPQEQPFRVPGHPDVRMVPTDSYIANYLFWLGLDSYEAGEPAWWASLVASHTSVLEIGANVGLYTLVGAAAAPGRPYRAVEPNPASCDVLRRNLVLNGLDHVDVVEAAVVGERTAGEVTLRFPDRDPYRASAGAFVDGALDLDTAAARAITVPTAAISDLVDGVDLVKLDIEGLEVEALGAVRPWIVASRPTIVVEVRDDAVHLQQFLRNLLDETDHECFVVTDRGPVRVAPTSVTEGRLETDHGTRDVTLVEPERVTAALETERLRN